MSVFLSPGGEDKGEGERINVRENVNDWDNL
jgi:hypothetical protein